jgi:hypothetical protein
MLPQELISDSNIEENRAQYRGVDHERTNCTQNHEDNLTLNIWTSTII